ncbi:MAG: hypothetical protein Q9166_000646 [cf. Caloplaca sp. 2 TL-2023]
MGVYTKIFFQSPPNEAFGDKETQFFLFASHERGYYLVWQNFDQPDFLPGRGVFFGTVVTEQSYRLILEGHQNLRANTGRVWYAGEATSSEFYCYLHGAYFEGKSAGEKIAACLKGDRHKHCDNGNSYEALHGTTREVGYAKEMDGRILSSRRLAMWDSRVGEANCGRCTTRVRGSIAIRNTLEK